MDLTRRDGDAAGLCEVAFRFEIGLLVGALQANELRQRRGIAAFQAEGGIGGVLALGPVRVVIIRALQLEVSENSLHGERLAPLAEFPGFGLIGPRRGARRFAAAASRPGRWPT